MEQVRKGNANRTVVATNVSLFPPHRAALDALARKAGHGNNSRIVQESIADRAEREFGPDWVDVVTTEQEAA